MNNIPYISILVSCYNYNQYVERCLDSCLNQTFKDFEIIIVDDASTDNSVEVIETYINSHPQLKIRFYRLPTNGGPAVAKSTALNRASGEYVIFVDCDDWMDENCLEILAENAKRTNADKLRAQCRTVDEDTKKVVRERIIPNQTNTWAEGMMHATLFKRSLVTLNNIDFCYDRNVSDDLYFISLINSKVEKTEYIRKTLYSLAFKEVSDSGIGRFNKEKKLTYARETNKKVREIYNELDRENKIGCEYLFAKQYFFLLLQYVRVLPFNETSTYHRDLRQTIDPYFPKFYKNKNIKLTPNGDPFLFRCVVYICAIAERLHLMNLLLKVYWIAAKKFKFVTR